jgi:hypothetical protein
MARRHLSKAETGLGGLPAISSHAYKRMDRMTLMAVSLVKLMSLVKLPRPLPLRAGGASLQAGSGSKAEGTQAAHNLPRDLLVNERSFWSYADEVKAHPRVKLQIFYSSAATMTVSRRSNYLDSCWEKMGLGEEWVDYLRACTLDYTATGDGSLGAIVRHAEQFKQVCQAGLARTIAAMEERETYQKNQAELDPIIQIYEEVVAEYQPAPRLQTWWRILHNEKYG